jgi:hypothetical protein
VLIWPGVAAAQSVTGQARAVQAKAVGTTVLADTGTLADSTDARDATVAFGLIPSLLSGQSLRAVTVGWPDQVASEASVANLTLALGTVGISADLVMARALASANAATTANTIIENLSVNGIPIVVTGVSNQRVAIPGGQLLINEKTVSPSGTTINALRATVLGVADVVVASATAGIQ